MASLAGHLSFIHFLLFLAFSSLHVQARESQLFSKMTTVRYNDTRKGTNNPVMEEAPAVKREEPPTSATEITTGNGYGLYGRGPGKFQPPETNTRYPNYEHEREQYGLSDTRVLENGRYFYDADSEDQSYSDIGGYDPTRENPAGGVSGGYGGYDFGNNNYYKNQNGYEYTRESQENQEEEYVP